MSFSDKISSLFGGKPAPAAPAAPAKQAGGGKGRRRSRGRKMKRSLILQGGNFGDNAGLVGGNAPMGMQGGVVPITPGMGGGQAPFSLAGGHYTRRLRKRSGKARQHRTRSYSAGGKKGRKTRRRHRKH